MSDIAIRAEGLSKLYRLGQTDPYKNFREVIVDAVTAPLHRLSSMVRHAAVQEPYRRMPNDEHIWALRDVSFDIKRGEVVGIVGSNGAGKSTLLKILSRITEPTKGRAEMYGRLGSLLEVGTGFHPELTGRENIYLNGIILGMKKEEVKRRFDEIVAFAEVEEFLDTPVKRYSSGMYVRLAFAVAAHLEPEILIVDEVLAVGDAAFQQKCLGKMENVAREGRTVLFVSHNMHAVQRLCPTSIMLDQGQLIAYDDTAIIMQRYLSGGNIGASPKTWIDVSQVGRVGTGESQFMAVQYSSLNQATAFRPYPYGPLEFSLVIESNAPRTIGSLAIILYHQSGIKLVNADTVLLNQVFDLREGRNLARLRIKKLYLNPGIYRLGLWLANPISASAANNPYDYIESAFQIEVVEPEAEVASLKPNSAVTCDFDFLDIT